MLKARSTILGILVHFRHFRHFHLFHVKHNISAAPHQDVLFHVKHLLPNAELTENLIQNIDFDIHPQNLLERINSLLKVNGDKIGCRFVL